MQQKRSSKHLNMFTLLVTAMFRHRPCLQLSIGLPSPWRYTLDEQGFDPIRPADNRIHGDYIQFDSCPDDNETLDELVADFASFQDVRAVDLECLIWPSLEGEKLETRRG